MLVLSRRAEEAIAIGEDIRVRVLGIRAGKVKLGIDAPAELHILREELRQDARGKQPEGTAR